MYQKKDWVDRVVQNPGRRLLTNVGTGDSTIYDVTRNEGTVTAAGDPFSADTMNGLETRIKTECDAIEKAFANQQTTNVASTDYSSGDYLVYNGVLYKVNRQINTDTTIVPGVNVDATTVGAELKRIYGVASSAVNQVTALGSSVNTAIHNLEVRMGSLYRPGSIHLFENIQITNGSAQITIGNISNTLSTRAYGLTVTSGQTGAVYGGTFINSSRTNVVVRVSNLSNPSYTGTERELVVIVWGE